MSLLLGSAPASANDADGEHSKGATCAGGPIAAGTYRSLTVTGTCFIPGGSVNVRGNVSVKPGAVFLANSPPGGGHPEGDATLTVGGDLSVGSGAILILGCSPAVGCTNTTHNRVGGDLRADRPLGLLVHSNTFESDVVVRGGGGGVSCVPTGFFAIIGSPAYTTFEDNVIGGRATVSGMRSCWFGFIRNNVGDNVTITDNAFADEDATEVVQNTIGGNLRCTGNDPAAQVGDSGGLPNIVEGRKIGECAAPGL